MPDDPATEPATELPTPTPERKRQDPYLPFEADIVRLVIHPRILRLLEIEKGFDSKAAMLEAFNAANSSSVHAAKFDEWLDRCGLVVSRRLAISYKNPPPVGQASSPVAADDPDVPPPMQIGLGGPVLPGVPSGLISSTGEPVSDDPVFTNPNKRV